MRTCINANFLSKYGIVDENGTVWDTFLVLIKGPGGPMSIFTFLLFLIEGNGSYQELFFGMEQYCSKPKLLNFQIAKIRTITLCVQTLIAIPQKSNFKIYLILQFLT